MNTQTISGTLTAIKRLNNSYSGNPNYRLTLTTSNGHEIPVGTLNDSMVNYAIDWGMIDKPITLKVKVNRYSNKLLDIINEEVTQ